MEYRKELPKEGRPIMTRGPRDLQRRQRLEYEKQAFIKVLEKELVELREKLAKKEADAKKLFTPEQVDEELRKVVKDVLNETGKSDKGTILEVKKLQDQITKLEGAVKEKDQTIDGLKTNKVVELVEAALKKLEAIEQTGIRAGVIYEDDPNRPQVEGAFIDPLEKGSGNNLELFTQEDRIIEAKEEDLTNKIGRLKDILGKKKED